jgi:hypothetical protein
MSTPKDASNADRLAAAEGQAAVEAIAEAETEAAGPDPTVSPATSPTRKRKGKAAAAPDGSAPQADATGGDAASTPTSGAELVPVMAVDETVRADSVSITQGNAVHVEAGTVSIQQGGVQDARAEHIDVRQGGVLRADVDELTVTQGGVGLVRADNASIRQGGAGAVIAEHAELSQSMARLVIARGSVRLDRAFARTVMAGQVEVGERGFAGLVIARTVTGQGRILLDWRAGLALGAAFALVFGLLRGRSR